jgi:plastocyanin
MRATSTLVMLSVATLVVAGCSKDDTKKASAPATTTTVSAAPAGPQSYTVVVDGPSVLGAENRVYGSYFPKALAVRPGDTIVFDNRSSNDVHTVTFGIKADRSDQPGLAKDGGENPAVFESCFSADGPKPDLKCPAPPAAPPEFAGKGYWNSGVILPTALPPEAGPKQATVKVAAGTAPGPYTVFCLLHPFMQGTLNVVATDGERQSPAVVAAAADKELGDAKTEANGLAAPAHAPSATGATVTASWGDKLVAVNRFDPETVAVKVGQTVVWRDASAWMPHTVSFQPPFKTPSDPHAFLPAGAKSGARFAGGVAHSGMIGPKPFLPTDSFSLTFTKAGKYPYLCLLHPGMAGTVEVS